MDNKNEFKTSRINGIKTDSNDKYIAVLEGDVIAGICTVYVNGGENDSTGNLPSGTGSTTYGNVTLVTDKKIAASNLLATVSTGNSLALQFSVDMGQASASDFTINYVVKENESGATIASGAYSDSNRDGVVNFVNTNSLYNADKNYTVTISSVIPTAYSVVVGTVPSGVAKNDVTITPASMTTNAGSKVT